MGRKTEVAKPEEINPSNEEPSAESLARIIRSGGDWRDVLGLFHGWVRVRSRILFYACRDLFAGMNEDDALDEVQDRFVDKLRKTWYAGCKTAEEMMGRTRSFLYNSARETRTARIRRKREVLLGEQEPVANEKEEEEDSFDKQMLLGFLHTCIEELDSARQREMGRLMSAGWVLADVGARWGITRQGVWKMFQRMTGDLRDCIERKKGAR